MTTDEKFNLKVKVVFGSLMILSIILGIYGIIDTCNNLGYFNADEANPFSFTFMLVPIIKYIGVLFLK